MGKIRPDVTKLPISTGGLDLPGRGQLEDLSASDNDLDFPGVFVLILTQVKHRRRVTEFQANGQR